MTRRHPKVPIYYRDLNTLLKEPEKHKIIKQIGSLPQDKLMLQHSSLYLNSLSLYKEEIQ